MTAGVTSGHGNRLNHYGHVEKVPQMAVPRQNCSHLLAECLAHYQTNTPDKAMSYFRDLTNVIHDLHWRSEEHIAHHKAQGYAE